MQLVDITGLIWYRRVKRRKAMRDIQIKKFVP